MGGYAEALNSKTFFEDGEPLWLAMQELDDQAGAITRHIISSRKEHVEHIGKFADTLIEFERRIKSSNLLYLSDDLLKITQELRRLAALVWLNKDEEYLASANEVANKLDKLLIVLRKNVRD